MKNTIPMQSVESSQIAEVGHQGTTLAVRFNTGALYYYANVSEELFSDLLEARPIGAMFNLAIKSKPSEHPFTKINEQE